MSREHFITAIQSELERLNQRIDLKIIRGRSYVKEAKRHRFLLAQLSHLALPARAVRISSDRLFQRRPTSVGWLGRAAAFITSFTL